MFSSGSCTIDSRYIMSLTPCHFSLYSALFSPLVKLIQKVKIKRLHLEKIRCRGKDKVNKKYRTVLITGYTVCNVIDQAWWIIPKNYYQVVRVRVALVRQVDTFSLNLSLLYLLDYWHLVLVYHTVLLLLKCDAAMSPVTHWALSEIEILRICASVILRMY